MTLMLQAWRKRTELHLKNSTFPTSDVTFNGGYVDSVPIYHVKSIASQPKPNTRSHQGWYLILGCDKIMIYMLL